jgi:hypothetical protein
VVLTSTPVLTTVSVLPEATVRPVLVVLATTMLLIRRRLLPAASARGLGGGRAWGAAGLWVARRCSGAGSGAAGGRAEICSAKPSALLPANRRLRSQRFGTKRGRFARWAHPLPRGGRQRWRDVAGK